MSAFPYSSSYPINNLTYNASSAIFRVSFMIRLVRLFIVFVIFRFTHFRRYINIYYYLYQQENIQIVKEKTAQMPSVTTIRMSK